MTAATIFALQLVCVCALGLQSLNVNNGHRLLAALTSIVISITSLYSLSLTIVRGDLSPINVAAFITGSIVGILLSMQIHPWLATRLGKKPRSDSAPPVRSPTAPTPRFPDHWNDAT